MLIGMPVAWHRDGIAVIDATGYGFTERICCFDKSLGLIAARSQTFRQITERDHNFIGAGALQPCRINKTHFNLLARLLEITSFKP